MNKTELKYADGPKQSKSENYVENRIYTVLTLIYPKKTNTQHP